MIKIEFPADRPDIARAMAKALHRIGYAESDETRQETDDGTNAGALCRVVAAVEETGEAVRDVRTTIDDELGDEPAGVEHTTAGPDAAAALDNKGVAFNAEFCGKAAIPVFTSGKRAGQWKKRKGVSEENYDAWYAGALTLVPASTTAEPEPEIEPEPVDVSGAFGAEVATLPAPPTDTGTLMGWVSEKQAAGLLTQPAIDEAYARLGISFTALFPPTDSADVTRHVNNLYGVLAATAGA